MADLTDTRPGHPGTDPAALVAEVEALGERLARVREAIGRVIFGQQSVVDQTLITLLSGGHALLVGVPGLGKTKLVETLGAVLGLDAKRVQFTPDLMPADIIGSEVLEEVAGDGTGTRRAFRFIPGPVFCQLLMADEINRASPRTQSALLQAMQEHRVAVAGEVAPAARALPRAGHAEPDRAGGHLPAARGAARPLPAGSRRSTTRTRRPSAPCCWPPPARGRRKPVQAMTGAELIAAQALIRRIPVGESVLEAILTLVRGARPEASPIERVRAQLAWGPGPRAAQALMLATRARAVMDGRLAPSVEDVLALAEPVLRHRMALNFSARAEGVRLADVIDALKARLA